MTATTQSTRRKAFTLTTFTTLRGDLMLTIRNTANGRQTDYSRQSLQTEAKHAAKFAPESDGKLRAWSILVIGSAVALRADYLSVTGEPRTVHVAL